MSVIIKQWNGETVNKNIEAEEYVLKGLDGKTVVPELEVKVVEPKKPKKKSTKKNKRKK